MVSFHIQGLMDIVDVSFDKGFPVKVTQMWRLISTKIECITLRLKDGMVVDPYCPHVLSVEGSMRVNV